MWLELNGLQKPLLKKLCQVSCWGMPTSLQGNFLSFPTNIFQCSRETNREEMNSKLCNFGSYTLKAKLWLLDKQGSRTYVKARKQERQWCLQKLVLGERRNNARQGKTVSNWVVIYKLINSGLLSFHPFTQLFMKKTCQDLMAGLHLCPQVSKCVWGMFQLLRWLRSCYWLQHIKLLELISSMRAQMLPLFYSPVQ